MFQFSAPKSIQRTLLLVKINEQFIEIEILYVNNISQ